MNEVESGPGVPALQVAEGDVLPRALAVGLEIEQQHRVAVIPEEPSSPHHAQPVGADAVHQDHHPAGPLSPAEPPPQPAPGRARDLDDLSPQIWRRRSDHGRLRRGQGMPGVEEGARGGEEPAEEK